MVGGQYNEWDDDTNGNAESSRNAEWAAVSIRTVPQRRENWIEINAMFPVHSVAFTADGDHIVSGHFDEGRVRRWAVDSGKEVGTPLNVEAQRVVRKIAVTHDGEQVVSVARNGRVTVWDAGRYKRTVKKFKAHNDGINVVDISPDTTTIATGSEDCTATIWSFSTGERLLGPFEHDSEVTEVKFSPDGRLIATATSFGNSVRIYDGHTGSLLVDSSSLQVSSYGDIPLAWASDSTQLFILSPNSYIHCLDTFTRQTVSKWAIRCSGEPTGIALASNDAFLAVCDDSSEVSFWDTTTHNQIGGVVDHPAGIASMAISANYDLVVGGGTEIILWDLLDVLPSPHSNNVSALASKLQFHRSLVNYDPFS